MKGNKYLENLIDLIGCLRKSELITAKKHLVAYQTNHTINSSRMLALFLYIQKNTQSDFLKVKRKVSNESNNKSFERLILRTIDRVRESLIVEVNINRKDAYSEIFRKKFQLRKKLMQAHILEGRGLVKQALDVYKRVVIISSKFELYDELIESKSLQMTLNVSIDSRNDYILNSQEIEYHEACRIKLRQTKELFNQFSIISKSKDSLQEKIKRIEEIIKITGDHASNTNSANIKSYYYLLLIEYYSLIGLVSQVIITCNGLLELLEFNPAVYSINRISYLKFSMAEAELNRLNFLVALNYSKESIELTKKSQNINYLLSVEFLLYSLFYLGRNSELEVLVNEVLKLKVTEKYKLERTKIIYIQSINYFVQSDFTATNRLLSNIEEFEKDKAGWNVWIRVMRILCSIEQGKFSYLEYEIENFRKFMQRTNKLGSIRERDNVIMKLLVELNKSEFDFEHVYRKKNTDIEKLKSPFGDLKWDVNSAEMVLFHDWFMSKVNKESYCPNFQIYIDQMNSEEIEIRKKFKSNIELINSRVP